MSHQIYAENRIIARIAIRFDRMHKLGYTTAKQWHQRTSQEVYCLIFNTLKLMDKRNIVTGRPDFGNSNWKWGIQPDGEFYSNVKLMEIYRFQLESLLTISSSTYMTNWKIDSVTKKITDAELIDAGFLSSTDTSEPRPDTPPIIPMVPISFPSVTIPQYNYQYDIQITTDSISIDTDAGTISLTTHLHNLHDTIKKLIEQVNGIMQVSLPELSP